MACNISRREIEKLFQQKLEDWLEEYNDTNNTTFLLGETYFNLSAERIDSINEFFAIKASELGDLFVGGLQLLDYKGDFSNVTFQVNYSKLVTDYIESAAKGDTTDNSKSEKDNYKKLLKENLEERFIKNSDKLYQFTVSAIAALKKIRKIRQLRELLDTEDQTINSEITKIWVSLQSKLDSNNFEDKVAAFVNYLVDAENKMQAYVQFAKNMSGDNKLLKLRNLYLITKSYKPIIDELNDFAKEEISNELGQLIASTKFNIDLVQSMYLEEGANIVSSTLYDNVFKSDRQQAKYEAALKEIEDLKSRLEGNLNDKLRERLEKKLVVREKELTSLITSSSIIKDYLLGKHGDINTLGSLFLAASSNSDPIVSGFGAYHRNLVNELVSTEIIPLRNRFQSAWDKYTLKENDFGGGIRNPEQHMKKYIHEVKDYFFDIESGKVDHRVIGMIKHGVDPSFYEERSQLEAEVYEVAYKRRRATGQEYLDLMIEESKRREKLNTFYRNSSSQPFTDIYYEPIIKKNEAVRRLLEEENFDIGSIYGKLEEEENEIYLKGRKLTSSLTFREAEDNLRLKEIRDEKRKLRSTVYLTKEMEKAILDSPELEFEIRESYRVRLKAAAILSEFQSEMNDREKYVFITDDYDGYEAWANDIGKLKELLDAKSITPEEHASMIEQITKREYSQEWIDLKNGLVKKRQQLILDIVAISGVEQNKEKAKFFQKILDTVNPYRDELGAPDGSRMSNEELLAVKNWEETMKDFEDSLFRLLGASDEYFDILEQRKKIFEEIEILKAEKEELKELGYSFKEVNLKITQLYEQAQEQKIRIEEIRAELFEDDQLASLYKELQNTLEELGKIIEKVPTSYYEEEYQKQLDIFIQSDRPLNKSFFRYNNYEYKLIDNIWYKTQIGSSETTPVTGEILNIWRNIQAREFVKSDWFQNNHIVQLKYNPLTQSMAETYVPTYAWSKVVPSTVIFEGESQSAAQRYPIEEVPAFQYSTKIVRETLNSDPSKRLHSDKENDPITGRAKPKDGLYIDSEYENLLDHQKEFLQFLLKEYSKSQELQPTGKRMGYRIPTIIRSLNLMEATKDLTNPEVVKKLVLRNFVTTEQDIDSGEGFKQTVIADAAGVEIKSMTHYFASHAPIGEVSSNIFSSIMKYSQLARKNRMLADKLELISNTSLDVMENNTPIVNAKDKIWQNVYEGSSEFIKSKLGVQGLGNAKRQYSQNARLRIMNQFENNYLYGADLNDDMAAAPSFKLGKYNVRIDKMLSKLRGWKSFSVMSALPWQGFEYARQLANVSNGVFNSVITSLIADGEVKFTFKQYRRAIWQYTTKYYKHLAEDYYRGKEGNKSKFGTLLDYFNVLENRVFDLAGEGISKQNNIKKLFSSDLLFAVRNSAELFLYSTTFLAYMNSVQVKHLGRTISLLEAYDFENFEIKLKEGVTQLNGNTVNEAQIRRDIQVLLQKTQGNYADMDKTLIENTWYGAGLMWMKKFLVEFFLNRYGVRRYNINELSFVEGYWNQTFKSIKQILLEDPRVWTILTGENIGWKNLTAQEKSSVKRTLAELTMIFAIAFLINAAYGYDDDDKDRFKKLADNPSFWNWGLYYLLKTQGEAEALVAFGGIDEFKRTVTGAHTGILPFMDEFVKIFQEDMYLEWTGVVPTGLKRLKRDSFGFEEGTPKIYKDVVKLLKLTDPKKISPIEKIKSLEQSKRL